MSKQSVRNPAWYLLLFAVLSGCGWQLQGARPVSPALLPIYIEMTDTQSLFARHLQQNLQTAGIQTTRDLLAAGSVLQISKDESGHLVTSVSALNQPQQYEIYYRAEYRLDRHDKAGEAAASGDASLIPLQALSASRTMSYDSTQALAKQREQQAVEDVLAQELTRQVLRRLNSLRMPATAEK